MDLRILWIVALLSSCGSSVDGSNSAACADCDGGAFAEERIYCVDVINDFRADAGKEPLQRSAALEDCAAQAAAADSASNRPHGNFSDTRGCGVAFAENEVPGWPLARYADVRDVVMQGAQMMYDEGPGGGHYENITGDYSEVGCGILVTADESVWVVHNFR